jgi:thiamine-monophosphate kinase
LHGGEDYELLFTAQAKTVLPRQLAGVMLHAIGRMKKRGKGPQVVMVAGASRTPLTPAGWEHFR